MQEALNNVTRHAKASKVKVDIRRNTRTIRCVVTDDGVGFDLRAVTGRNGRRGLGLLGIRERVEILGGQAQFLTAPGRGTKLTMALPALFLHPSSLPAEIGVPSREREQYRRRVPLGGLGEECPCPWC